MIARRKDAIDGRYPILDAIARHAEQSYPFECCGIVTADREVIPLDNAAAMRQRRFVFCPTRFARIIRERGLLGVYHSHVECEPTPSQADLDGFSYIGKYYFIASVFKADGGYCREVRTFRLLDKPRGFVRLLNLELLNAEQS